MLADINNWYLDLFIAKKGDTTRPVISFHNKKFIEKAFVRNKLTYPRILFSFWYKNKTWVEFSKQFQGTSAPGEETHAKSIYEMKEYKKLFKQSKKWKHPNVKQ